MGGTGTCGWPPPQVDDAVAVTGEHLDLVVDAKPVRRPAGVRPGQHALDIILGKQVAGLQDAQDLPSESLLDLGQVLTPGDGDAIE